MVLGFGSKKSGDYNYSKYKDGSYKKGHFGYKILFKVIVLVLIIWLALFLIKRNKNNETALDMLKKRYAKGEIKKKEFESIKKDIK